MSETRLNYKSSYLLWLKNIACGDLTGSYGVEKTGFVCFLEIRGGGMVSIKVCGVFFLFDLMVVVLVSWCGKFTYGEYGFNSIGCWSYFREWTRDLTKKLCYITNTPCGFHVEKTWNVVSTWNLSGAFVGASGKWNVTKALNLLDTWCFRTLGTALKRLVFILRTTTRRDWVRFPQGWNIYLLLVLWTLCQRGDTQKALFYYFWYLKCFNFPRMWGGEGLAESLT